MGITPRFSAGDINREIESQIQRNEIAIVQLLKYVGESCVKIARQKGNYLDQTGNLRSSIGYVVMSRGSVLFQNFERAGKPKKSSDLDPVLIAGIYAGALAEIKGIKNDYVLIVVAGMDYASTVESRGKDVITTAKQYAEQKVPALIAKLKARLNT